MKASLLLLVLAVLAPAVQAQSIATNLSGAPQWQATTGLSDISVLDASNQWVPLSEPLQASPTTEEGVPEGSCNATSTLATAFANGVSMQVETLAASGTVLVSFEMPPQQTLGLLELANARTGQVIYTGSILIREGQVELPVPDTSEPFEARLATDEAILVARMAR